MSEWKEYKLGDLITLLTDYHSNGSYKTLKANVELLDEDSYAVMIRTKNFEQNDFSKELKYIDEHAYNHLAKSKVYADDIIMNKIANAGSIYRMPDLNRPVSLAMNLFLIRFNEKETDQVFMYYYLKQNERYIKTFAEGSVTKTITKNAVRNLDVIIPTKKEQLEIVNTLNNLDQKITLLREQNQTLEELAQTLFKRWFIEFEFPCLPSDYRPQGQVNLSEMAKVCTYQRVGGLPAPDGNNWFIYVLLCEDGSFYKGMTNDIYRRFYEHYTGQGAKHTKVHKPKKVIHWEKFDTQDQARKREEELKSGYGRTWIQRQWEKVQGGLPTPECQLRMAGKMVDSELGEIPEGWELHPLEDLVKVHNGYSYKGTELQESNVAMVTLKNFDRNGGFRFDGFKELVSDRYKEKHVVDVGDLIVAHTDLTQDAEVLGNPALIMKNEKYTKLVVSMDLVKVESKHKSLNTEFLYYLMRDKRFKYHCKGYANGTTVLHLSKSAIPEYLFPFPKDMTLIEDFGSYAYSVYQKISNNITEIQSLSQLRDTLLPKLMSGELKLKELA